MPFTLAHPAIILPLAKSKRFSLTALIAGSMVPDFEFFFQMREVENIGHHWYGIVLFDVAVAMLLCYVFHNLLRNLFIAHLPAVLQSRVVPCSAFSWNTYLAANKVKVLLSILIGIASHILWDGFTHDDGLFVTLMPGLLANTGWQFCNVPVYHFLQWLSSIIGLGIVIYFVYELPQHKPAIAQKTNNWYWPVLSSIIFMVLMIRIVVWPQYNSFGGLAIATMGSITYGWLAASLIFKYILFKKETL
jgi:hypothetical protein